MSDKTVLIVGGVAAAAVVLLFLSKKAQIKQQAQATYLANQYANTTAGQVDGIVASVGSFFNSGALQSLHDAFLNSGSSNQPGLVTPSPAPLSPNSAANLNTPGLNNGPWVSYGPALPTDYYASGSGALPLSDLSAAQLNQPGLVGNYSLQASLDDASLGLDA